MIERAIESLARSGRVVRIRELTIGYMPLWRSGLAGAVPAFLLTLAPYLWYPLAQAVAYVARVGLNQSLMVAPPVGFTFLVLGPVGTLGAFIAGCLLGWVRRWTIRRGRFLVVGLGPVTQLRVGWHIPLGIVFVPAFAHAFTDTFRGTPTDFDYFVLALGTLVAVLMWETLNDLFVALLVLPSERQRAAVEYDLKEAVTQDQSAVHWRVHRIRFDPGTRCALLTGEFPTKEAIARAREVAMRVRGVEDVRLEPLSEPDAKPFKPSHGGEEGI